MLEKTLVQDMIGDDKELFGEGLREVEVNSSLGDHDTSEAGKNITEKSLATWIFRVMHNDTTAESQEAWSIDQKNN